VLFSFLTPAKPGEQFNESHASGFIIRFERDPAARVGQRLYRRVRGEARDKGFQECRVLPPCVLSLGKAPGLKVRLVREVQIFEELSPYSRNDLLQLLRGHGPDRTRRNLPQDL
jgi:hypothetical protein